MAQELDLKIMDRRLVDRLVRRGEITEKDLDKVLKALPDLASESTPVESIFEPLDVED